MSKVGATASPARGMSKVGPAASPARGMSKVGPAPSPRPDDLERLCTSCKYVHPKSAFPIRQWPRIDRRCKYCISSPVPFYRPRKKDPNTDDSVDHSAPALAGTFSTEGSERLSPEEGAKGTVERVETPNPTPRKLFKEATVKREAEPVNKPRAPAPAPVTSSPQTRPPKDAGTERNQIKGKRTDKTDTTPTKVVKEPTTSQIPKPGQKATVADPATAARMAASSTELSKSLSADKGAEGTAKDKRPDTGNTTPRKVLKEATQKKSPKPGQKAGVVVSASGKSDKRTPPSTPVPEPSVSLEEDIENLARTWTPPVLESPSPARAPAPSSAPPEAPESDDSATSRGGAWRRCALLFASPILDETGSVASVIAGLFSLFLVGSLIGIASKKNPALPTPWYQEVSAMIGYIYFLCWSVSFYPQVISNYKRKTTAGLSADFCALNVVGFSCYTAYNASLFWSPTIRELYRQKYGSDVTVQSNDVAFAIHALLLSSITLAQIAYYRGSERPSKVILTVIVLILMLCAIYPALVLKKMFTWLDYLYVLSFVKIGISFIKYMPQVVLNYRRKSTVGWSIWNILLDFTGGVLSDLQLVLDCTDMGDFSGITGNLAKFGLGFVSIVFDIIFMTQHYILYPDARRGRGDPSRPETEPLLGEEDRRGENAEHAV